MRRKKDFRGRKKDLDAEIKLFRCGGNGAADAEENKFKPCIGSTLQGDMFYRKKIKE